MQRLCRSADHLCVDLLRRERRNPVKLMASKPRAADVEDASEDFDATLRCDDGETLLIVCRLLGRDRCAHATARCRPRIDRFSTRRTGRTPTRRAPTHFHGHALPRRPLDRRSSWAADEPDSITISHLSRSHGWVAASISLEGRQPLSLATEAGLVQGREIGPFLVAHHARPR